MTSSSSQTGSLSPQEQRQLDAWLEELERSWVPERLGVVVRQLPIQGAFRQRALEDLVKFDLRRRWQTGAGKALEEYLEDYPELGNQDTVSVELIQVEFRARRLAGEDVTLNELGGRFPRQVEELQRGLAALLQPQAGPSETRADQATTAPEVEKPQEEALGTVQLPAVAEPSRAPIPPPAPAPAPTPSLVHPVLTRRESFGRYKVHKELGRGAMGTVYLADDTKLGRPVALKIPHFNPGDNPDLLERFYREARSAAKLRHANICQVYDVGDHDNTPYLTMEFIEGKTLHQVLQHRVAMGQREAAEIVRKLALALDNAHRSGVIHRDLKPSNVMMDDRRGDPVVMDFGLARQVEGDIRMTGEGSVLGTPAYMSPEQVNGVRDAIGPSSDIYSLGVVLYELVTGQVPFQGSLGQVMSRILAEQPKPPTEHNPKLDRELEKIILKAMQKDPKDRYPSMLALAKALEDFLVLRAKDLPDEVPVTASDRMISDGSTIADEPQPRKRSSWKKPALAVAGIAAVLTLLYFVVKDILIPPPGPGSDDFVEVALESDPPGAIFFVDGEKVQANPLKLKPKSYELKVENGNKYKPFTGKLEVTASQGKKPFRFSLEPLFRRVRIETKPPGAKVFLNKEPHEQVTPTLVELPFGKTLIRVEHRDYDPQEGEELVVAGPDILAITKLLLPKLRKVSIATTPQGAKLFLDGKEQKPGAGDFELRPGSYKLEAELDGKRAERTIEVLALDQVQPFELIIPTIPTKLKGEKYALLVGVRQANVALPDFLHAEADVEALARLLLAGGFAKDKVKVLTISRAPEDKQALFPTSSLIRTELAKLEEICNPADRVLLAFVGPVVNLEIAGTEQPCFCPGRTTLNQPLSVLPLRELFREAAKIKDKKKAAEVLVLLDGWRYSWQKVEPAKEVLGWTRPDNLGVPEGVSLFVGCGPGQRGYEHPDLRHGLFMYSVLRNLVGENASPTLPALADKVRAEVMTLSSRGSIKSQTPALIGTASANLPWLQQTQAMTAYKRGAEIVDMARQADDEKKQKELGKAAYEELSKALDEKKPFADALRQRGAAAYFQGDLPAAITDLQAAAKLAPNDAETHANWAEVLTDQMDINKALELYDKVIQLDPKNGKSYYARGLTYLANNDKKRALKDFSDALELNRTLKAAFFRCANLHYEAANWQAALEDLNDLIKLDSQMANAYGLRSYVHRELLNTEEQSKDAKMYEKLTGMKLP